MKMFLKFWCPILLKVSEKQGGREGGREAINVRAITILQ